MWRILKKKIGSFSLIERVILSAGAMLIFSVYFHLTICPEGRKNILKVQYNPHFPAELYRLLVWMTHVGGQLHICRTYMTLPGSASCLGCVGIQHDNWQ
ncbi:hypothetical protein VN97_g3703 [Penicillium thymicola]|uniref:Uncharacterized protein n=1 Tax=Penicillium thymicola TaxID=293382 RepID=A0AAI9TM40_PENTH|nr:hypothetical protein VN97_g3703 [Penicillium thymicola]